MSRIARPVLGLVVALGVVSCGRRMRDGRFATALHYQGAGVVARDDGARPRSHGELTVRAAGLIGARVGPLLALSISGGAGAPGGGSYDVALVPLGLGLRLHGSSFVGVGASVVAGGGTYHDDAIALGGQAYAELALGRRLRWVSYARLAEDLAVADDIDRRHLEVTAALRVGRSRRDHRFTLGNGYYLGATLRERQGEQFWGLVVGHSLDAAR